MRFLQEISRTRQWSELEAFKDRASWETLSEEERSLLADLFALYGEELLEQRNVQAFDCFEISLSLAPSRESTLWTQIKALVKQPENMRCQEKAHLLLGQLVLLNADSFETWITWARVCMNRALFHSDLFFFQEAAHHYSEAEKRLPPERKTSFYLEWGRCYYQMGLCSGESADFRLAVKKYLLVYGVVKNSPSFLLACGLALFHLALLVEKGEFLTKAISFFLKAVELDPKYGKAWKSLSIAYQELFTRTLQQQHFSAACNYFRKAIALQQNSADLWIRYGRVQFVYAFIYKDWKQLENCLEAFAKAADFTPDCPKLLGYWAEAESLYGLQTEDLDFLKRAENHAKQATEISPEESECWRVYGSCLVSLGYYFSDEQYYLLAIERLCQGVLLDDRCPLLYSELASAYFFLGSILYDEEVVAKSLDYFEQSLACKGEKNPPPPFLE